MFSRIRKWGGHFVSRVKTGAKSYYCLSAENLQRQRHRPRRQEAAGYPPPPEAGSDRHPGGGRIQGQRLQGQKIRWRIRDLSPQGRCFQDQRDIPPGWRAR